MDDKIAAKALRTLQLLENRGNALREPFSKPLGDGIFELRIRQSNVAIRVMYFFYVGNKIVVINGFAKKTQKTPKIEIERARNFRKDWLRRHGNERPAKLPR